jgi:hypothetical protein
MLITNKNEKKILLAFTGMMMMMMMMMSWMELVRVVKWQLAQRRGETEGSVNK